MKTRSPRRARTGPRTAHPKPVARPTRIERLWAPWRMKYVAGAAEPKRCLFCHTARMPGDRDAFVVARRPNAFVMLNRFPYNPGHLMVAVSRHAARFEQLTEAERTDLFDLLATAERVLASEYHPDGMNYGANVGRIAGAGFPGHLHLHLVPRWSGDTNFMPVVGGTKVLPETLAQTWRRLCRAWPGTPRARGPRR